MADFISMLAGAAGAGGAEETDPDFKQTVLLLHGDGTNGAQNNTFLDSSTNNFTITRNGNTTQGTFSPFSLAEGQWSNFFDGTDDYLSVADNAVLRPGAGAFTLEAWVYRNAAGAAHTIYAKGGASTGINFQITSGNVLRFTHTTTNIDSTGTVAANAWVHVAVVREGTGTNQTKLYINGTQDGQGTVSTDFTQTEEVRIGTNRSAGDDFAGYISNVRFVKGSALYTGNFTPSTSPLTTTSQGASSSEVELLTCQSNRFVDNSTNAFAITRNGDVRVTPFSPFAPTAAYSASVNGGSGYFDGSGDYLSVADNAAFDFAGNFTVEFWAYPLSFNNTYAIFFSTNVGDAFQLAFDATSVEFYFNGSKLIDVAFTRSSLLNGWHHFVVTRSGSTIGVFIDGTRLGTGTSSATPDNSNLYIGSQGAGTAWLVDSYISSFRLVNGSAVYDPSQTTLSIPTAPLTAITNTSLLLNFTNAGIFDNTSKNNLETVGNAQIDTTTKKYGTGSMDFDGTGDRLLAPHNINFDFGSGNWTIECWVNPNNLSAINGIFAKRLNADTGVLWMLSQINTTGVVATLITTNGSSWAINANTTSTVSASAWTHLAWVRNGSDISVYVGGVKNTLSSGFSGSIVVGTEPFVLGATGTTGSFLTQFNGYIDDFRITKGVARYTAAFTPPDKAFPDQ